MDIREHVVALNTQRARIWNEMQNHLDDCQARHKGQPMSAEEREKWDRMEADIQAIDAEVRKFVAAETAEQENAVIREAHAGVFGAETPRGNVEDQFAAWVRGDIVRHDDPDQRKTNVFAIKAQDIMAAAREREMLRAGAGVAELRNALLTDTGSIGSAVPTTMARTLYEVLEANIAMFRAPTTRFNTASGENMEFPKLTAHAIGTQVIAQGTVVGGTDPTFDKVTLGAFRYGQLIRLSSDAVTDTVFPVTQFVARDIGRALGRVIDADLVVGTGSGEPFGIMAAGGTGIGGTVSTGGSLIDPTYETLINVEYSVADAYRSSGSAGWLMRDSTAGTLRKLRDGNGGTLGAPLWQFSLNNGIAGYGQPDQLLGYPAFVDANVAALASNARIIGFGDFSAYYIRQVGDVLIERDDSRFFDTDEVAFRGKWRVDGDLLDNTAWNILKRSV